MNLGDSHHQSSCNLRCDSINSANSAAYLMACICIFVDKYLKIKPRQVYLGIFNEYISRSKSYPEEKRIISNFLTPPALTKQNRWQLHGSATTRVVSASLPCLWHPHGTARHTLGRSSKRTQLVYVLASLLARWLTACLPALLNIYVMNAEITFF